jgi:hypothetical protein
VTLGKQTETAGDDLVLRNFEEELYRSRVPVAGPEGAVG